MQDRPTGGELINAVREFLERDVMDATEGRVQFHTRVAINALRIVERELADDGSSDEAVRVELVDLLGRGGTLDELVRELAVSIRDGRDPVEVIDVVRDSVRAKLAVANPEYLAQNDG